METPFIKQYNSYLTFTVDPVISDPHGTGPVNGLVSEHQKKEEQEIAF